MRCPRCSGRMFRDLEDEMSCVACGYYKNDPPPPDILASMSRDIRRHDYVRATPTFVMAVCEHCAETREVTADYYNRQKPRFCSPCAKKLSGNLFTNIRIGPRKLRVSG